MLTKRHRPFYCPDFPCDKPKKNPCGNLSFDSCTKTCYDPGNNLSYDLCSKPRVNLCVNPCLDPNTDPCTNPGCPLC